MLFNTMQYIIFLPLVVLIYYLLPSKARYIWLLAVSYYFYMQWNPLYITLLFLCTILTYGVGRIIDFQRTTMKTGTVNILQKTKRTQKICFVGCVLINLCILIYFKYSLFAVGILNKILNLLHLPETDWNYGILLPVGISFYILQALGYLIDIYRGEIEVEKNFLRYALFVSFFPQLVAGPIERSKNLLTQLHEAHSFSYENIRKGALLVLYGLFLKMVIADRSAIIVNTVYGNSSLYPGLYIVVATVFFSIQIYCDFYGYSTIAKGSALMLGIHLMDNFNAPYFSKSVKEFWRRWHISLSGWFRDYLYIPLGGSRKGNARTNGNLLFVFAVSGLWHGASVAYILWGFLNGIYQVIAEPIKKAKSYASKIIDNRISSHAETCANKENLFSKQLIETIFTFMLITFAWLFFRAGSLTASFLLLKNMFS